MSILKVSICDMSASSFNIPITIFSFHLSYEESQQLLNIWFYVLIFWNINLANSKHAHLFGDWDSHFTNCSWCDYHNINSNWLQKKVFGLNCDSLHYYRLNHICYMFPGSTYVAKLSRFWPHLDSNLKKDLKFL